MDNVELSLRDRMRDAGLAHSPSALDAESLLTQAHRRQRHERVRLATWAICAIAAAGLVLVQMLPAQDSDVEAANTPSDRNAGGLSESELAYARTIVQEQAAELGIAVTGAYARMSNKTVEQSNAGNECTSGSILTVQILGSSDLVHGNPPGTAYEDVRGVLILADPQSKVLCSIGASTASTPLDDSTALLDE